MREVATGVRRFFEKVKGVGKELGTEPFLK
jgi:hypothetical protein